MLSGKSVWHVHQDIGRCYAVGEVKGYYNNMTEKVTMMPELLETDQLPSLNLPGGKMVAFPVAVFQYGLGAYDLYLSTGDVRYLIKFRQCVDWSMQHQDEKGRWDIFSYIYPVHPYGAMAQGEGASLLIRAYRQYGDAAFLSAAQKALDFMLLPISEGGTTVYEGNQVILLEYTHLPVVLNGWIFALWGLYDYNCVVPAEERYRDLFDKSVRTLTEYLPRFSSVYWSRYDLGGSTASPFYHDLHIAQLQVMSQLTPFDIFEEYAVRWETQAHKSWNRTVAFVVKAAEKLLER